MATTNHICRVCDAIIEDAGLGSVCKVCGVGVNAEFQTIRESRPSSLFLLAAGLVLFIIAAREVSFGQWEAHQILILGLCVLVTWVFISHRPNEVVLWEQGVVLIERGGKPRQISWHGIAAVRSNQNTNCIEFVDRANRVTDSIPVEFLGTWRRADRFADQASSYIVTPTAPDRNA